MGGSKRKPGLIAVSSLHAERSESLDELRERAIRAELRLSREQRMVNALSFGLRDRMMHRERREKSPGAR